MAVVEHGKKQDVEFVAKVEKDLPLLKKEAEEEKGNNFGAIILKILALEKKARNAEDVKTTVKIAMALLEICFENAKYQELSDNISLLCKRQSQLKTVIQKTIQKGLEYCSQVPKEEKVKLIETLRVVSSGKIIVELEEARLTRMLSDIKLAEGDLKEACKILQETQVETVGSMKIIEKAEYLMQQMELCLKTNDFVRTEIISNKVNKKWLGKKDFQDLKLRYYALLTQFQVEEGRYFDICKSYLEVFATPKVQEDKAKWKSSLTLALIYLLLSEKSDETAKILDKILKEKKANQISSVQESVKLFTTSEIISSTDFAKDWQNLEVFTSKGGVERADILKKRVHQHNLSVLSKYYTEMEIKRAASVLGVTEAQAETLIAEMVSSKQLYAKMNRPKRIVSFQKPTTPNKIINDWSSDINALLDLIGTTCHLIDKENIVHSFA